jgi:hypothetical protein
MIRFDVLRTDLRTRENRVTDAHRSAPTDAATRQHRRVKRGLVASWIHEISARHGATPDIAERTVETVRTTEPALEPQPSQALA